MKSTKENMMSICVKNGKEWKIDHCLIGSSDQVKADIYYSLSQDLINKKVCNCSYITKIVRYSNYDGTQTIKVYYDNNVMRVYVVDN